MIEPGYVRTMARYNSWQNDQITDAVTQMDEAALTLDRKAFFGSIFGTLNHLLWGDTIWMSRFTDKVQPPAVSAEKHKELTANINDWSAERLRMDEKIRTWADGISAAELQGDLEWYSGITQSTQSTALALCIMQLFNHQTHHRGQVHAMLTAAGQKAPVTDIPFMPDL